MGFFLQLKKRHDSSENNMEMSLHIPKYLAQMNYKGDVARITLLSFRREGVEYIVDEDRKTVYIAYNDSASGYVRRLLAWMFESYNCVVSDIPSHLIEATYKKLKGLDFYVDPKYVSSDEDLKYFQDLHSGAAKFGGKRSRSRSKAKRRFGRSRRSASMRS